MDVTEVQVVSYFDKYTVSTLEPIEETYKLCIQFCQIAMFLVTSPIVINVPTRGLLAVETMHAIVQWLANLNIKRNT